MEWTELLVMIQDQERFGLAPTSVSVHVISLRRTQERAIKTIESLQQQDVSYKIVEAVDGLSGFSADVLEQYAGIKRIRRVQHLFERSRDEVLDTLHDRSSNLDTVLKLSLHESLRFGCYLSHVLLWRQLLDSRESLMIVLEDDVTLEPKFSTRLLRMVKSLPESWDLLFLNGCFKKMGPQFASELFLSRGGLCTYGYAISFNAAAKLFRGKTLKSNKPIDHLLDELVLNGKLIAFHADPPLVRTVKSIESTLAYYS